MVCKWCSNCAGTKCPLDHTPNPKIYHRNYMDGIPIHARNCTSERFQVECLYTVLFPKALYRPTLRCRQVWRLSHTLKAQLGGILLKCEIPVPPWELDPHCMCTPPKYNRLVLISLRIITHHVWGS